MLAQFFGKISALESGTFWIFLKQFMSRWISTRWFLANDTHFLQKLDVLQHIDDRSNPEQVLAQFFGKISALESGTFWIFLKEFMSRWISTRWNFAFAAQNLENLNFYLNPES